MTETRPRGSWTPASRFVPSASCCHAGEILRIFAFLVLGCACLRAQTAHFGSALTSLGSGFSQPAYAAFDATGNLYVTDQGTQSVYELTAASGFSAVKTLSTAFQIPTGIAVDASGNVFVTDQNVAGVYELTAASNYATVITVGSGFANPNGVAVDAGGNVFVADTLHNAVKEILAVSGSIPAVNPTINTLGGTYNRPTSVALDSNGNVFVADLFNSQVKEIVAAGGYTTVNTLGSGFSYPAGVATDTNDNVYVTDSGNGSIKEILASGGYTTTNTLVTGLPYSTGAVINRSGNVFIASFSGSRVFELTLNGAVGFGSLPVATTSPESVSLNFVFDTSGTIAVPAVLTQGASGLDFTDAGTGTCTTNGPSHPYSGGDSCSVVVQYLPGLSGNRYGAVTLSNTSGVPVAAEYISGTGTGPQVVFTKNNLLTSLGGGFLYPSSIALDGSANVFLAEPTAADVKKIQASGGYVNVQTLGGGFSFGQPAGVAVDGAGNLIVADYGNSQVDQVLAKGGYVTVNVLADYTTFNAPQGVAVDGSANIFITDQVNGAVYEMLAASGYSTVTSLAGGFSNPNGVAVDGSGNVFVADTGHNAIKEVMAVGGVIPNSPAIVTLGGGFSSPNAVAVDASGALFVADSGHSAVKTMPAGCLSSACVSSVGGGFQSPFGVALPGNGNLFLVDYLSGLAQQLNFRSSPSLTFAGTAVGATSSDSPRSFTLSNDGNAPLTFEVPGTGVNPSLTTGFTFSNSSTCPQVTSTSSPATLASGASCVAAINFAPAATGSITGAAVITDDALNAVGPTFATQSVALSGLATAAPVTATTVLPSVTLTRNHVATPFIPVTASGGSGTLAYSISPALPAGLIFSTATGTISGTPTAVTAATSYTVTVTSTGATSGSAAFSLTVDTAITATTVVASAALTQNHAAVPFIPVTASGATGTLTDSISPALPAGLTFSSASGTVSGTPAVAAAVTTYTVTVSSPGAESGSAVFSLSVNTAVAAVMAIPSEVLAQNQASTVFMPVTGSGGTSPLTYSISPALPSGLSLSSSTGGVSGTPTVVSAAANYTVTVTDRNGATASATFNLTVSGSLNATATALSASNLNPGFGASDVLTATVTPVPADVPPGTVNFLSGATLLGSSALAATGVATLSVTLPQGPNAITAVYSGSVRYAGSTSGALAISALATTAVTFTASPTTQLYNNPIVLTAQAISPTAVVPTGTISFLDGTTVIAAVAAGTGGQASYSVASLAQGSHSLTAAYSGDSDFQASASAGTGIAITVGNINLNLGNDQNQTIFPGGAASYTFPLSPVVTPTFLYDVALTATGLPPGATYTFSPATIPAGSSTLPVTLTVQTARGTASLSAPLPGANPRNLRAFAFVCLLPLFGLKSIRGRLRVLSKPQRAVLMMAVSLAAMLALNGCGAGGLFGRTATSGPYTITVTATSADLVRTSTVQLTIQ